jgi:UDP-glucose 4-epimerase
VSQVPFGSENFLKLAGTEKFDLLCHHAAEMVNYRSPDFDALRALQNNLLNARAVLKILKCPVALTGSVFENDEGAGDEPLRAFSPYGLSKGLTFQFFRHYCHEAGVPLGKFVIPNPFGPFEEPRFTAHLMRNWQEGKSAGGQNARLLARQHPRGSARGGLRPVRQSRRHNEKRPHQNQSQRLRRKTGAVCPTRCA